MVQSTGPTPKAEVDSLNSSDSQNDHYLATITSELEQAEIAFQIGEVGINAWLGGNDVGMKVIGDGRKDLKGKQMVEQELLFGVETIVVIPFKEGSKTGEKMNQTIVLGLIPLTERIIYKLVKGVLLQGLGMIYLILALLVPDYNQLDMSAKQTKEI